MRDMSVIDYDPRWPAAAEAEAERLRSVLGDVLVRVHHIGSTAVPGLAAKPVIDLLLEVADLSELDALDEEMRSIGYRPSGEYGIPGRRYYPKGGDDRTHHAHAFVVGDRHIMEHLAFRDYLRTHPEARAEYSRVKREAASRHRNDPEGYVAHKRAFVARVVREACDWAIARSA